MCCATGFALGKNTASASPSSITKLEASTATLTTDPINGSCGTVLNLDGTNDYIDVSSLANNMNGSANFTIGVWINTTATGAENFFAVNNSSGGNTLFIRLTAGKLVLASEDSTVLKEDMSNDYLVNKF